MSDVVSLKLANHRGAPKWLHLFRVAVFITIILLIHFQHKRFVAQVAGDHQPRIPIEKVRALFQRDVTLGQYDSTTGGRAVLDTAGEPVGLVVTTSPQSDDIVGFSGPTNVLIAFDHAGKVRGLDIISSGDTPEHLQQVLDDPQFLRTMNGLTWSQAKAPPPDAVDGVSGATLTSMAIVESIVQRLAGVKPSLRFPESIKVEELTRIWPTADQLASREDLVNVFSVHDAAGHRLGSVLRTSSQADDVVGYQGPTDVLIALDEHDRVMSFWLRRSYDNEPYVGYVREEAYFVDMFVGKSLGDIAALTIGQGVAYEQKGGIHFEGVSGATMTSMAVVESMVATARASITPPSQSSSLSIVWDARFFGTASVVLVGLLIGLSSLRGKRVLRIGFQLVLIVYLGFINGDMLSQAVVVGWSQSNVPWQRAPGLVLLVVAALVVPIFSKRQIYCHHLCPFGAMQELVKNRLPWRLGLSRRTTKVLKLIPAVLLLWALLVAMLHLPFSLVNIEPFDAFIWSIAGGAVLAIAIVGLVASLVVPMAYCRFGCPTGALLQFLRRRGVSDQFVTRDWAAIVMLLVAIVLLLFHQPL
jgi:NosR/NirI family transcriptional regulator, nitrous oxide reductase regulator